MTDEELEKIAAEVIRQIKEDEKKSALLLYSGVLEPAAAREAQALAREGFVLTGLLPQTARPWSGLCAGQTIRLDGTFSAQERSQIVSRREILLVSGLSLVQLAGIRDLAMGCPMVEIICEALRQGKEIRVYTEALEAPAAAGGFAARIASLRKELTSLGLLLRGTAVEEKPDEIYRIDKKVVCKQDVIRFKKGTIAVGKDAVFTTTAAKWIGECQINIKRC